MRYKTRTSMYGVGGRAGGRQKTWGSNPFTIRPLSFRPAVRLGRGTSRIRLRSKTLYYYNVRMYIHIYEYVYGWQNYCSTIRRGAGGVEGISGRHK